MESTSQILRRLIARHAAATIEVRTGGGCAALPIYFLKEGERNADRGIWIQMAGAQTQFIDRLIKSSSPVLVKINDGPRQLSFVSSLLSRHRPLLGPERVLAAWPASVKSVERRRSRRERMPSPSAVTAALIRGGEEAFPGAGLTLQVWDLSAHGACLICPPAPPIRLRPGDTLEIRLGLAGAEHRSAARHRRTDTLPTGQLRLGVEFVSEGLPPATATQLADPLENFRAYRMRRSLDQVLTQGA